jgi:integrase/recombinase XerC
MVGMAQGRAPFIAPYPCRLCRDLWAFLVFLGRHHGALPSSASLRALSRGDLSGLHPGSTARALAVVRGFFRFLARHDLGNNPVIIQARNPKVPHSVPKALNEAEAMDALEAVGNASRATWLPARGPWVPIRDVALLTLLYGCGLRLGEALSLKRADVAAIKRGRLVVTGNGDKQRIMPVLPIVGDAIEEYLTVCPYEHDPLFLGFRGGPYHPRLVQGPMQR